MLSAEAKEDLIARCKFAMTYGYGIASAEEYAREMGYAGEDPPYKTRKFSPAHLLHLAGAHKPDVKKGMSPFTTPVPSGVYTQTKAEAKPKEPKKPAAKKAEPKPLPTPKEPEPAPRQEDIPTVPVNIKAIQATVKAMKESLDVVVLDNGPEQISVVRALREITGEELRDIEMMISWLPSTVKRAVSRADAEAIKTKLEAAGAKVELRSASNES